MNIQENFPLNTITAFNIGGTADYFVRVSSTKELMLALDFAEKDGETLVIITADHETGGMAITGGNPETGMVKGAFPTGGHTGVMVPVFSYGPGAEEFIGIMDNTEIHSKMKKLLLKN